MPKAAAANRAHKKSDASKQAKKAAAKPKISKAKTTAGKKSLKGRHEGPPDFTWVKKKLTNSDFSFAMDHQVSFLTDLFDFLMAHHNVQQSAIEKFISETKEQVTLGDIFKHFQINK